MTETPDATTVPRETGQEKATRVCPGCGAELGVIETSYGGVSAANCTTCYPQATEEQRQQAAADLERETGTDLSAQAQTGAADDDQTSVDEAGEQSGAFGAPTGTITGGPF